MCWGWGCRSGSSAPTQPGPGGRGALSRTFPRNPGPAPALPLLGQRRGPWGSFLAPGPWPGGWATSAPGGLGTHKAMDTAGCSGPDPGAVVSARWCEAFPAGDPFPFLPRPGLQPGLRWVPRWCLVVGTSQPPGRPCLASYSGEGPLAAPGRGGRLWRRWRGPWPTPHSTRMPRPRPTAPLLCRRYQAQPDPPAWWQLLGGRPERRFAAWALAAPHALPLPASAHASPCPAGTRRPRNGG